MRKPRAKLSLLSLESRITPSTSVTISNQVLTITGDSKSPTSVFLSGQSNLLNVYVVEDQNVVGAVLGADGSPAAFETPQYFRGEFEVTDKIIIDMGSADDFVMFTLDDGGLLSASIDVDLGAGSDDIQIHTRTNVKATIGGDVALNGGQGADNYFLFDVNLQKSLSVDAGGTGLRTLTGLPGDVVDVSNVNVAGHMSVDDAVTLIDSGFGPNTIGSLSVTSGTSKTLGDFRTIKGTIFPATGGGAGPGAYSGLLVIDSGSTVLGPVTYDGSSDNDGIYVYGTINGGLSVSAAGGTNDLFIGDFAGPGGHVAAAGTVKGGVTYDGGAGVDHLRLAAGTKIEGGATFNMSGGDNLYDLAQAFSLSGLFTITAGGKDDNVGLIGGTVSGNESFDLGGGDNTLVLGGIFTGTTTNYTGGAGVDSVTLAGAYKALVLDLGSGKDVFRYAAGSSLTSFFGDFGPGKDTYDKSAVVVSWPETLIGLP